MVLNRFFHSIADRHRAAGKYRYLLQPGWRSSLIPLLVLVCLLWTLSSSAMDNRQSLVGEYELKAVYLFNFLHFVYWPAGEDIGGGPGPKVIGVVGKSPLYDALLQLRAKLRESNKGDITIIDFGAYKPGMDFHRCNLVFISSSEKEHFAKITAVLKNTPVLTVSDIDDFLTAGGMIALVTRDHKVRWEINRTPAQAAGLRFSAKLLDIAVRVVSWP